MHCVFVSGVGLYIIHHSHLPLRHLISPSGLSPRGPSTPFLSLPPFSSPPTRLLSPLLTTPSPLLPPAPTIPMRVSARAGFWTADAWCMNRAFGYDRSFCLFGFSARLPYLPLPLLYLLSGPGWMYLRTRLRLADCEGVGIASGECCYDSRFPSKPCM
ncbi:uncharacterized protein EI97DRAFT_194507 [Westerdykella ornata]|uniref:Uncharacterized protein n=1 Tax=Westerdykella ornata TaxID=318751 RepID=A0A6A6J8L7_WESOR|nr:uncharacterized protein EI97DRAFT_194507 [Westerdykella ornata]KAF2272911.1 hypothetical protein EI97DRAFT_194507 [Westerdykella ornata]